MIAPGKAVRWRIFQQAVREARRVSPAFQQTIQEESQGAMRLRNGGKPILLDQR